MSDNVQQHPEALLAMRQVALLLSIPPSDELGCPLIHPSRPRRHPEQLDAWHRGARSPTLLNDNGSCSSKAAGASVLMAVAAGGEHLRGHLCSEKRRQDGGEPMARTDGG
jgi:hypothetical protein